MVTSSKSDRSTQTGLSQPQSWSRRAIFALLSQLKAGHLIVVSPEGDRISFGNGQGSAAVLQVLHEDFFQRCLLFADLGLAESYMDGLVEIPDIKALISFFLINQNASPVLNESPNASRLLNILGLANKIAHAMRQNSKSSSKKNIREHYDLGNDFFELFLDETMTYSSALFCEPQLSLKQAQEAKFERIARQLKIRPGDRVLEVGSGWGAFSCYLAITYSCRVTGLTISEQQYQFSKKLIEESGLDKLIEIRLQDYREHKGSYDKIASIEMIEAVGDEYMDVFISKLDSLLAKDGILTMQMITSADSRYQILQSNVDFIQKHIFPGSLLPSLNRISQAMMSCGDLFLVDLFDMTPSYVLTLRLWQDSFEANLDRVRAQGFDERFIRKWRYYFEYCQAAFAMRNVSVVQATYSRPNNLRLAEGSRSNA